MPTRRWWMPALALLLAACAPGGGGAPTTTPSSPDPSPTSPSPSPSATECSAGGPDVAAAPARQRDLPQAVAQTRGEIIQAAVACDYERLVELTGEPFTYSFGLEGDAAGHWRRLEAEGRRPMRFLSGLLNRPYGTVTVQGRTQYVWPSAFAYEDWEQVPEADREALKPLYDEDDFADFARFGGYMGYRVGIVADGEWLFFVAGD